MADPGDWAGTAEVAPAACDAGGGKEKEAEASDDADALSHPHPTAASSASATARMSITLGDARTPRERCRLPVLHR